MPDCALNKRLIGVVVPVSALRSKESVGVGEFADLVEFAQLAVKLDIGLIQLLPVNDTGYESSPYFALTAFALNPIYLRIGDIPESEGFRKNLDEMCTAFEGLKRVPYYKVAKTKIELLRDMYDAHKDAIEQDSAFNKWITANGWIAPYAVYRVLKEENDMKSWMDWPTSGHLDEKEIDALWNNRGKRARHLFWAWVQYHLDKQFSAAAKEIQKLGIVLKGDIPILMNIDSADVWAHPDIFNNELSAGAPPDMYSPAGQNWGFPIYDWQAQEKNNFAWWKERLKLAGKYYGAYRIDHVLGFFRIWSTSRKNDSAALGRYVEADPIKVSDMKALGYDSGRIRWICEPHIPTHEIWDAVQRNGGGNQQDVEHVFNTALERIGNEELWLFKNYINGEQDIRNLDIHPSAKNYLCLVWANRIFLEYEQGCYAPLWYYKNSRAYLSLSAAEKEALDKLIEKKDASSQKKWEAQGKKLLAVLVESSPMQACAEDLGAVPLCVPKTLAKLKIFGLRVVRWHRQWDTAGQPYIPLAEYPELSVCTPSVHDSSTMREWWENEAEQDAFAHFIGAPSLPKVYNPGTARIVLKAVAAAASRIRVFQMQDLLHLSPRWYGEDPADDRINVPGTCNEFNWCWRLPATICEIADDVELVGAVKMLAAVKKAAEQKVSRKAAAI